MESTAPDEAAGGKAEGTDGAASTVGRRADEALSSSAVLSIVISERGSGRDDDSFVAQ